MNKRFKAKLLLAIGMILFFKGYQLLQLSLLRGLAISTLFIFGTYFVDTAITVLRKSR